MRLRTVLYPLCSYMRDLVMETKINKWGNSAAVRLPASVLTSMGLELNSPITIDVIEGKIVIAPADNARKRLELPFSEAFLLESLRQK